MAAQVFRTRQSRQDYLEIWHYIAQDNVDAANRLLDSFDQKLELIADVPGIGNPRDELESQLRSFRVGNHLLFYRPVADGIELIRVLHGARDIPQQFKQEP
ncbi:MAG: type II toxin-antitoxin system RelE/ParE family toxin [Burkholderiales bacterium]